MSSVLLAEHEPRRLHSAAPAPSVLAWLPLFWRQVLFPGRSPDDRPLRWRPLLALVLLSGCLIYPSLSFHLFEPDEGRYAQIPREMLERSDWLVPTLQGEPYLDKPPLFYWLVMSCYALFGYHAWAARLVPALAMHGTIIATYVLGRRLVGARSAWWGALLLTVAPAFLGMGRLLLLDGLLTLWVTLSLFAALLARQRHGWWTAAAVFCGVGVLTKGPVALVLVVVPLLLHRWLCRGEQPSLARWAQFAAIVAALAGPWYVAACWRLRDFAYHFLWQHNVMRFAQPFDHERPVWFFVPIVLLGLLPATLLARPLLRSLLSGRAEDAAQRSPELGYLLLAGGWCVFFFSLSGCKLPTYILPAFPPLCLAAGQLAVHAGIQPRTLKLVLGGHWLVLLVGFAVVLPWYAETRSPMNRPAEVHEVCSDPSVPVVCFPRHLDSIAFYLGRSDFLSFRSKQLAELLELLDRHPRVVLLFAHRHSLQLVREHLPPHLRLAHTGPLGLCDLAVVERIAGTIAARQ
jgi:4-amino-4-deoxy-L-arabinose transferase-like glycosyltransferase